MTEPPDLVRELRELIVASAPDPAQAAPVQTCSADEPLDGIIPFSSVIVLGTVIAVEDRFGITVKRTDLARVLAGGVTLMRLATMIEELRR
jgi:acyl carrier protein